MSETPVPIPSPGTNAPEPVLHYEIAGAKGGQGTTTVATALAILAAGHCRTALRAIRPDDAVALAGAPPGPEPTALVANLDLVGPGAAVDAQVCVEDLGRLSEIGDGRAGRRDPGSRRWLVVRGPCYLSLKSALGSRWRPDGVILLTEPGRALGAQDMEAVLDVGVVADVPVDEGVARCLDAGLLPARLHRLSPFRRLGRLVAADVAGLAGPGLATGEGVVPASRAVTPAPFAGPGADRPHARRHR